MVVDAQIPRKAYVYSGTGTNYATTFTFLAAADLAVKHTDSGGVDTLLTLNTHYTVSGGHGSTGSITVSDGALESGANTRLTIYSNLAIEQQTDLEINGGFNPTVLEAQYDRNVRVMQQLQEEIDRSVKTAVTSDTNPDDLMEDIERSVANSSLSALAAENSANAAENSANAAENSANAAATALGDVSTEGDKQVNRVLALGGNQATDKLGLLNYAHEGWLSDKFGSEGAWSSTMRTTIIPDLVTDVIRPVGGVTLLRDNSPTNPFTQRVTYDLLRGGQVNGYGVTFGDSGKPYETVYSSYSSGGDYNTVELHPKHGDVSSDFTTGNTYTVLLMQEDANKTTGTQTLTEYFLGSNRKTPTTVDEVMGGSGTRPGVVNVGYWGDTAFESSLLSDVGLDNNRVNLKLSRHFTTLADITSVELLAKDGSYVSCVYSAAPDYAKSTPKGYSYYAIANIVRINVKNTWAILGYSSQADMLANSAVKVAYTHDPRAARPAPVLESLVDDSRVYYSNSHNAAPRAIYECIGAVSTGNDTFVDVANVTHRRQGSVNNAIDTIIHNRINAKSNGGSGMLWTYSLADNGTNYVAQVHFCEIVHDVKDIAVPHPNDQYNAEHWYKFEGFDNSQFDVIASAIRTRNIMMSTTAVSGAELTPLGIATPSSSVAVQAFRWDLSLPGHKNILKIKDYVTVETDAQGNEIMLGTVHVDLGIPSTGAGLPTPVDGSGQVAMTAAHIVAALNAHFGNTQWSEVNTGPKGDDGADGATPVKGVDYSDGAKGDKGDKGNDGADGTTIHVGNTPPSNPQDGDLWYDPVD